MICGRNEVWHILRLWAVLRSQLYHEAGITMLMGRAEVGLTIGPSDKW